VHDGYGFGRECSMGLTLEHPNPARIGFSPTQIFYKTKRVLALYKASLNQWPYQKSNLVVLLKLLLKII